MTYGLRRTVLGGRPYKPKNERGGKRSQAEVKPRKWFCCSVREAGVGGSVPSLSPCDKMSDSIDPHRAGLTEDI